MTALDCETLKELIEDSPHVEFADYGEGCSEDWITKAEGVLGYDLPHSYKWWLTHFGGGEVGIDNEIYSIYEMDFEHVNGGDIVFQAITNKKSQRADPKEKLYVYEGDHHAAYFDIAKGMMDGEYEIVEEKDGVKITHQNFCRFLTNLIEFYAD